MPMFRRFVPERIRPLIYLAFAFVFQLNSGVYLGSLSGMQGDLSMLQEDVMMCGYAGLIGVTMPFPLLFRLKFRFSNKWMLSVCAAGLIICNIAGATVRSLPLLWIVCYAAGWFKLWGTFECISNIQLWMAPGRDFFRFFPLLYILVLGAIECSGIMAQLCGYFLTWEFVPVIMVGLLVLVLLALQVLTVDFRPGPPRPMPLFGIDWTGLVLWSLLLMELAFIFIYGEHYNWWDGVPIRFAAAAAAVTGGFCIGRMRKVRHPYIEVKAWKYSNLVPTFIIFLFVCVASSSSNVLEGALKGSIVPSGLREDVMSHVLNILGIVCGSLLSLLWFFRLKLSLGRLTIVGMVLTCVYSFMMFFLVSPDTPYSMLLFPTFMRNFGYSIIFTSLTLYIQVQMPFQHFFQGLCIIGMARTVLGGAIGGAVYGFLIRLNIAGQSGKLGAALDRVSTAISGMDAASAHGLLMQQSLMMTLKNLYGYTFVICCAFLILMMAFDSPVRRRYITMPNWATVRKYLALDLWK